MSLLNVDFSWLFLKCGAETKRGMVWEFVISLEFVCTYVLYIK